MSLYPKRPTEAIEDWLSDRTNEWLKVIDPDQLVKEAEVASR